MKKILMIGLLIFAMTGTAMAWNSSDHVTEAKSMVGDVLIFPVYLADGTGWEVDFKVINTSSEYSAVSKVVFHGGQNSKEIFDFFIFLSPDDMWTGAIYNENGRVRVYSDDDSARTDMRVFASETNPMDIAIPDKSCEVETYGYVTVFNDWHASRAQMSSASGKDYSKGPIAKLDILDAWLDASNGIGYTSANLLTGSFDVRLPSLGLSASENAVALRDYGVDNRLSVGLPTLFGEPGTNNSVTEIEASLSKETVFMPYYNDGKNITANIFTFPTKQTDTATDCTRTATNSTFFTQHTSTTDYCIEYGIKPFDLSENTPGSTLPIFSPVPDVEKQRFCDEVNVSVVNLDELTDYFDEGWALFTFQLNAGFDTWGYTQDGSGQIVNYTGAPVIPLSANLGADGLSLKYGAYSNLEGESRSAAAGNGSAEGGYWYDFGTLD